MITSATSGDTCGISLAMPVPSFFGKLNSMCDACLVTVKRLFLLLKLVEQILRWSPEYVVDLVHLVKLVVAGEEREEREDLEENAANAPVVHLVVVVSVG